MKLDAVFQGGGVKATGLVGALCRIEECGVHWMKLAGTSAGAIIASLIAVGYTGEEIKHLMYDVNYTDFKSESCINKIPFIGKILGLVQNKGLFNTGVIEEYLNILYKNKGKNKFKDLYVNGESTLKIIASDVTNKKLLILPEDIREYGIEPKELDIAKAVVMSISIPFFFRPTKLDYRGEKCFIVDGGLTSNYPIWIFDVKGTPRWPTIGFKLEKSHKNHVFNKFNNGFFPYVYDVMETAIGCYDEKFLSDKDKIRTISIPTLDVKTIEFNISKKEKKELFDIGYKKADEFIRNWSFKEYIRKHRSQKVLRMG
ncbi:patatin-like phospholipase family protein [Hathewaya histolytica]|uniref:patatin-like phospholipase family protein n=1 Tax=Hathewaya histolytica TaxID=1498 RepID=UPI003B67023D